MSATRGMIPDSLPAVLHERKQTILNVVVFRSADGEPLAQGCRFHVAPCEDHRWFAWAEAHQPPDDPEPCDALYDFFDGVGKAFDTQAESLAAIYEYAADFCRWEVNEAFHHSKLQTTGPARQFWKDGGE